MSYSVIVQITCDHPGCKQFISWVRENRGGMNKTWAGYLAYDAGWWVKGRAGNHDPRRALCPEHRAIT